jgi:hypothetical protein
VEQHRVRRTKRTGRAAAAPRSLRVLVGSISVAVTVALGFVCWTLPDEVRHSTRAETSEIPLQPRVTLATDSFIARSLRTVSYSLSAAVTRRASPFDTPAVRTMVAASDDPFLAAFSAGQTEGELVVRDRSRGVTTLGFAGFRSTRDREVLRSLNQGLGGSFSQFFTRVMSHSVDETALALDLGDENPFAVAMRQLDPGNKPAPEADPKPEPTAVKEPPKATQASAPPAAKPAPPASTPAPTVASGAAPVVTVRPNLMMRVDERGALLSDAVSHPREGVFESAEMGLRNFKTLVFSDPADAPFTMAGADFNRDGEIDLVLDVPQQGLLRFYYGNADGTFSEGLRVQVGRENYSLAAGDFDGDGWNDLAVSQIGVGLLTVFYGDSTSPFSRFRIFWIDTYRDYITAADTTGSGNIEVVGMNVANRATVLLDFKQPNARSGRTFDYVAALSSQVSASGAPALRVSAALVSRALSLNLDNRLGQLTNVLNLAAGTEAWVIVGDLESTGHISAGLAISKR